MPTIIIRDESGAVVEREVTSRRVVIAEFSDSPTAGTDDLTPILEPAVPQRVEWDDEGGMSTITTVCGETENRRDSDRGTSYIVEGIITDDQLEDAKTISQGDNLTLVSDIHSGPITVKRVTIEQNTDLVAFKPNNDERKLAFTFQMQFKQPDTAGG